MVYNTTLLANQLPLYQSLSIRVGRLQHSILQLLDDLLCTLTAYQPITFFGWQLGLKFLVPNFTKNLYTTVAK